MSLNRLVVNTALSLIRQKLREGKVKNLDNLATLMHESQKKHGHDLLYWENSYILIPDYGTFPPGITGEVMINGKRLRITESMIMWEMKT